MKTGNNMDIILFHYIENGKRMSFEAGYWEDGTFFRVNLPDEDRLTKYNLRHVEQDLVDEANELALLKQAA